jgi:hypothetical protein
MKVDTDFLKGFKNSLVASWSRCKNRPEEIKMDATVLGMTTGHPWQDGRRQSLVHNRDREIGLCFFRGFLSLPSNR